MKKMKRSIALLFSIACLLLFGACSAEEEYEPPVEPSAYEQEARQVRSDDLSHQDGIPAWLLAGLAAYESGQQTAAEVAQWYAEATARGLPGLTDEWFIPGLIEDTLREDIEAVSYAFVRHLSETDELDNLIALYRRDIESWYDAESWSAAQARGAEQARAELWADFLGADVNVQDVIFQYQFGDMHDELSLTGSVEIEFNALAQGGWYFFSPTPNNWTRETVDHFIDVSEEAIQFVGDFLDYHHEEPIISIFRDDSNPFGGGGWFLGGRTVETFGGMMDNPEGLLLVFAHEIAHALLELSPAINRSNFPMSSIAPGFDAFEEGLCVVIQYLFLAQAENTRFANGVSQQSIFPNISASDSDHLWSAAQEAYELAGGFADFEAFMAFVEEFILPVSSGQADSDAGGRATREEIIAYVDRMAAFSLANPHDWDGLGSPLLEEERYAELYDYYTAASFMFYLLEHRGTKEDFFRIYADIYLMEEVYGLRMEEMIAEWLDHLPEIEGSWIDQFGVEYAEWFMEWQLAYMENH